jgi:DNA-binding NtrC family response regulator
VGEGAAAAAPKVTADEILPARGIPSLEEMERELVTRAMRASGNNQTRAAELLGISRDQLRYRLKKFDSPTSESD